MARLRRGPGSRRTTTPPCSDPNLGDWFASAYRIPRITSPVIQAGRPPTKRPAGNAEKGLAQEVVMLGSHVPKEGATYHRGGGDILDQRRPI